MENLLKTYLINKINWEFIIINRYDIDGANCYVEYFTDDYRMYKENRNINIWEMLSFLNSK